jgi:hypothetical protein
MHVHLCTVWCVDNLLIIILDLENEWKFEGESVNRSQIEVKQL